MERFTRELIRALGNRSDVELVVAVHPDARMALDELRVPNLVDVAVTRGGGQIARSLWERYGLGRALERSGVRVVHGTKHLLPRTKLPTVLTVHDLLPITWPQQYTFAKRALLPRHFRRSLNEATVLLAVSNATAERLARLDTALGAKTVVAQNGLSFELLNTEPRPPAAPPAGPFALVVGDLSPRKNVSFLIDIWERVASATDGLRLVAVGPDGWRGEGTRRRLEELARRGRAHWARHVDDAELRWYYEHASVVLAPSLEEGFGLPVGEALSLGARVIASDDAALVEVSQGRAVHLPSDDAAAWIEAIRDAGARAVQPEPPPVFATWADHAARSVEAYHAAVRAHRRP